MKKGLRTVWNIVTDRLLYTVLYLSASVAWLCPYLGGILDFPMKVLFLWGVFIIAAYIFTKRIVFSGYKIFWLILFSASYCVTIFLNPEFFYSGVKYLIYNSLLLFIVYPTDKERLKKDYRRYITVVNDIVILLSLAASVASLVMFFLRISHSLTRGNTTFNLGIYYNRLHGVYTSANIGAFFSIVSIAAVIVIYCFNREHFRKWKEGYRASIDRIKQIDKNTNEVIAIYENAIIASKQTDSDYSGIRRCCQGKQKTCNGYRWQIA